MALLAAATVVSCALLGRPLLAEEDEKAIARAHYEAATRYYDIREYAKALEEYKSAYLAKPDPAFLFNIGQCHRLMGNPAEALDFFRQFLKKSPPDDPVRPQVEARMRSLEEDAQLNGHSPAREGAVSSHPATSGAAALPGAEASTAQPSAPSPIPPSQATSPTSRPAGVELSVNLPAKDTQPPPVYKRWWFWTGVSALVIAGGVTAAVLASRGGGGTQILSTTLGTASAFQ